jgi:hypothetical protein
MVAVGLVAGIVPTDEHWPGPLELLRTFRWQFLGVFTVAGIVLAMLAVLVSEENEPVKLEEAASDLARAVRLAWEYETARWGIWEPFPLPVRWVPADPDLVVGWSAVSRLALASGTTSADGSRAAGPGVLAGGDNDLADVYHRVPTRRLLVLGEPGAGKTILLARGVLELLKRRAPGEPVPVLLPLGSWNPVDEDFRSWIARCLSTARPGLARRASTGGRVSVARALLDRGLILPVLDGLDEIPDELRGLAIASINKAMLPGQGFILAARIIPYRNAVRPEEPGRIAVDLAGAAGIKICPLEAGEIAEYLRESAPRPGDAARWAPVIAAFTAGTRAPVAQALSTPLMVALARVIYNPRPDEHDTAVAAEPSELLNVGRFPDKNAIEHHLYDQFIPASYRQSLDPEHPSRKYPWTAAQAQQWLSFIARYLDVQCRGRTDFEWWKLPEAAPKYLVGLALSVVAGLAAAAGRPSAALGAGIIAELAVGLAARPWCRTGRTGIRYGLLGGMLGGAAGSGIGLAIIPAAETSRYAATIIGAGITVGVAAAPVGRFMAALPAGVTGGLIESLYDHAEFFQPVRATVGSGSRLIDGVGVGFAAFLVIWLAAPSEPARGLRWSARYFGAGAIFGSTLGITAGIRAGWIPAVIVGAAVGICSGSIVGMAETVGADPPRAADVGIVFRRDRTTFLRAFIGFGMALGLCGGLAGGLTMIPDPIHMDRFTYGLGVGLSNLLTVGLALGFIQATWGSFTVARWWLAASGQLPLRLMAFLRDAHENRAVLRQVGPVYQFKHAELQHRLAAHPSHFSNRYRWRHRSDNRHSRPDRNYTQLAASRPARSEFRHDPLVTFVWLTTLPGWILSRLGRALSRRFPYQRVARRESSARSDNSNRTR